uniref:FIG140336: TPR domain protein n=1 Tax=uncultured Thiotrichaceae bacterium TaxID=298394 RepID=A0A6S6U785_9GAMM|nr:MAG: FIG140336: TPR domain protein [uncultured Thiotrichaceae bacterium]
MTRNKISHRLAAVSFAMFVAGCTVGGSTFADPPAATSPKTFTSELSYRMYHTMAAEMMIKEGLLKQAAQHYAAVATRSNDPKVVRRATKTAIQAEEPELAKQLLAHWMTLEPDSVEVRQYRILLRSRLGEYDEVVDDVVWVRDHIEKKEGHGFEFVVSLVALEAGVNNAYEIFRRYVESVDDSPKSRLVVTTLAVNADKHEEALASAKIVQRDGNESQQEQAVKLSARALLGLNRTNDAVDMLKPMVKSTDDQDLKLEYARMLIMADRREEARPIFKQLYATQPGNADILYTLGLLYLEQKEYAFAEPLMNKLLKIPERKHEASYFLGQIYEGQERLDDALAAYDEALSGDFAKEAIGHKSVLLQREKGLAAAREWLAERSADADIPGRKLAFLMAEGQLLHDDGQYKEAVAVYDSAEQHGLSQRDILYARSLSYDSMGNTEKAEADLRKILDSDADDADAMNALGYMLTVNTERYDEAKKLITKALEYNPTSPATLDSMGWVLYKLNDLKGAEKYLREAFEKMPDPEVASHLIEVLSRKGEKEEAGKILKEMLAEYPEDKRLVEIKERLVELGE